MKLDQRLLTITRFINKDVLVDIGCDHGKLAVFALINGLVKRAICVDISQDSLAKAVDLVKQYNLEDKVEFICTDGKNIQFEENQCVVIAGLGGNEICSIIGEKHIPTGSILLPHQDARLLRAHLTNIRQSTVCDFVIKSQGKYYDVLVLGDGEEYTQESNILGKNHPNSQYYKERIRCRLEKINSYQNDKCSQELLKEKEILERAYIKANC